MAPAEIRPATPADLAAVAAIYSHFVHTSTATFDLDEPAPSTWQAKLDSTALGDHFLVARGVTARDVAAPGVVGRAVTARDVAGSGDDAVLGYAYSGAFRSRPAYRHTKETSVYLAPGATGLGLGTQLYGDLLSRLRQDGIHLAVAVVTQPNPASNAMHRRLGFTEVGTLDEVGYKFGAYLGTTYFQLRLT